jgi:hypothetical protein
MKIVAYYPKLYVNKDGKIFKITGTLDDFAFDHEVIDIMKSRANKIGIKVDTYGELVKYASEIGFTVSESHESEGAIYNESDKVK